MPACSRLQYRIGPVPAEGGGQLCGRQRPHRRARRRPALVGRALGAEPVRPPIMQQVAFNTPFQGANSRAQASSTPAIPGRDGRSSPPSWPSRGPTASPAASASDRPSGGGGPRRQRRGPFSGSGVQAAFRLDGAGPAAALSSSACSVLSRDGWSIFAPCRSVEVEDVDGALAIGGDMGAADHRPRFGDRHGELAEQGGAVAGVDLDHRVAARRLVIDEDRGLDGEGLGPA